MTGANPEVVPVILAGGGGSRLWPLSREERPKQFAQLLGECSLFQQAVERVSEQPSFALPLVVTGEGHRFLVGDQLAARSLPADAILLEPEGRNTAPAAALAAFYLMEQGRGGSLMLLLPSDHYIDDEAAFRQVVQQAMPAAEKGRIVLFGITPHAPETGYGYVRRGLSLRGMPYCYHVECFVEKPSRETAEHYLEQGRYLWNSGIFLLSARHYLENLQKFEPEVYDACRRAMDKKRHAGRHVYPDSAAFCASKSISIDYAVMERTGDAAVVEANMGWSDLGSWQALWERVRDTQSGNLASGDVLLEEVEDSYIRSEDGRLVAVLGVKDLVVVAQDDAVLVGPRSRMQEVRRLTEQLAKQGREEVRTHRTQQRPWGRFRRIDEGPNYQVKKLTIEPGGRISLQRHFHRAEHWIVVGGTARVTRGNEVFLLKTNESAYIRPGMVHRLENHEEQPLHIIEVQTGMYLGEDDIERLEDSYGRS